MKFELSRPAFLSAIAYLIMGFVIILPFNLGESDPNYDINKGKYSFGYRLMLLLLMLIPIGLSIYSINCFVKGKCEIWAWINSVVICLWVLLFVIAVLVSSESRKEKLI